MLGTLGMLWTLQTGRGGSAVTPVSPAWRLPQPAAGHQHGQRREFGESSAVVSRAAQRRCGGVSPWHAAWIIQVPVAAFSF